MALPTWFLVVSAVASVYGLLRFYFAKAVYCKSNRKFHNKIAIVTGCSSGLGIEVVKDLADRGCRVVLACRDGDSAQKVIEQVAGATRNKELSYMHLDLASLQSVREFVKEFNSLHDRLDILVNNAGVLCPKSESEDNFDLCLHTNVIGPFLLTRLLLDKLAHSAPSRVVNVVSDSYVHGGINLDDLNMSTGTYHMYGAYASSKLALILLTQQMALRWKQFDVTVLGAHPGHVATRLMRHWPGVYGRWLRVKAYWLFRTIEAGAQTIIHAAVTGDLEKHNGKVLFDCKVMPIKGQGEDENLGAALWKKMEQMVAEKDKNSSDQEQLGR